VCDRYFDVTAVSKMAEGVGGLEIALLIIGFFLIRLQADANQQTALSDVKPENLGFYASSNILTESRLDLAIQKLCLGQLDFICTYNK
jgi:hypothetical protein